MPPGILSFTVNVNNSIETEHWQVVAEPTVNYGKGNPFPEDFEVEEVTFWPCGIKLRTVERIFETHVSFKDVSEDAGPRRPNSIVEHWQPICEEYLARVAIDEGEVKLAKHEDDVFVKVVADELGNSSVSPSPVNKRKTFQKLELTNCVISRSGSLKVKC